MKLIALFAFATLMVAANAAITSYTAGVNSVQVATDRASSTSADILLRYPTLTAQAGPAGLSVSPASCNSACTYTISNVPSGTYYASDDAGTTWKNASTLCTSDAAITLNAGQSNTQVISNALVLNLVFNENRKYHTITYHYNGAGAANCNSTISSASPLQGWTRSSTDANTCDGQIMTYQQDFNNALTVCGFTRDETDATNTVFEASILINTIDNGNVIRGTRYARSLQTSVTIKIAFQTNITASTSNVVYGSGIQEATLTQQTWNVDSNVATLTLFTSVQFPYMLRAPTFTAPNGFNFAIVAAENDPNTDKLGNAVGNDRARCTTTSASTYADATSAVCNQYWTITVSQTATCTGSNTLELDSTHTLTFSFSCPSYFTGACDTPSPATTTVTFTIGSDNYCPVLISTQAASASLTSYSDSGFSTTQTQFVFGSFSYFEATVTSPILTTHVNIERISLTAGGNAGLTNGLVYERAFTDANSYFGSAVNAGTWSTVSGTALSDTASTSPEAQAFDNSGTTQNNGLTRSARFQWRWGSLISAATGDDPTTTTVQVDLRIRFTDQNGVAIPDALIHLSKLFTPTQDASTAAATVGVSAPVTTTETTGAASSSSSSAGLALSVVGIAAGVVGIVALVGVFTVQMLRRQREHSKEQIASVQLSSTTNLNTV